MRISKELAKGSTGLLVLGVLSKHEMYGYQIIKTVELMSENVFQMNEGRSNLQGTYKSGVKNSLCRRDLPLRPTRNI